MNIDLTKEEFEKIEKDLSELCSKYNIEIRIESNLIFKKLDEENNKTDSKAKEISPSDN
jgi:hypothetical protein